MSCGISELASKGLQARTVALEDFLREINQIHLVDGGDDDGDAEQRGDAGVAAGLGEDALARIDEDDGDIGGGGAGGHVAGVLLVAGRVGDDEFPLGRGEVAVGDVDGDSLLALGAEAVGELGEVDGGVVGNGADVVVVDVARVVKQAADEGGFAVVDAAGGGEAEQVFRKLGLKACFDGCIGFCGPAQDRR